MINWVKNLFKSSETKHYVLADFAASKKKRAMHTDPYASQFDQLKNQTGEYMNIDRLHQRN